ncbi:MAG TPA: carbohydrate ABC transporter permease [Streptosporangiaceae bacterium]|jgi:ABC-type glycerol-3-phosphate transport system permease component
MSATTSPAGAGAAWRPARKLKPRKVAAKSGFFVLIAIFVVASLFPFYWIVITSLKTQQEINAGTTSLLPGHITWSSYVTDFTQSDFIRPLLNSVIVALATTILTVIIAALAGYALARTQIRGKPVILGFILVANFFPIIAMVGPLFIAYRRLGLLNSYPALVISCLIYTLPLATWLLASYFSQIPRSLEEAALVDGSTRLQTLRKVIMPVALPGVFTAAILSFMLTWNDFTFALSFMSSPNMFTAPLAIVDLGQSQYQTFYNLIDAAVVIISIPIALLVVFAQRRIVSGLTAGSFR